MRSKRRPVLLLIAVPILLIASCAGLIRWIMPSRAEREQAIREGNRKSVQFPEARVDLERDPTGIVATISLENIGIEDVRGCVIDSFSVDGRYPVEAMPHALGAFPRGRKEQIRLHVKTSNAQNELTYRLKGSCYSQSGEQLGINSENSTSVVTK